MYDLTPRHGAVCSGVIARGSHGARWGEVKIGSDLRLSRTGRRWRVLSRRLSPANAFTCGDPS